MIIIVAAILLILSMPASQIPGHHGQTLYDVKPLNDEFRGTNITLEMMYAPLNVSELAYPFAYEIRKEPMSVEEAADRVRSFANDPSMDLTYLGNESTYFGIVYDMRSGKRSFSINPMTGQVFIASSNGTAGPNVSINMDEAKSIGTEYVRDHYNGFDSMTGMTLTSSVLNDHGASGKDYTIIWNEYIDGVQTLNTADVVIDADSGNVTFYGGIDLPVPALLNQTISQEQAISIALSRLGSFDAGDLRAYLIDNRTFDLTFIAEPALGDKAFKATITNIAASQQFDMDSNFTQRQAWNVILYETHPMLVNATADDHPSEDGHRYWVNVDAGTGEVLSVDRSL